MTEPVYAIRSPSGAMGVHFPTEAKAREFIRHHRLQGAQIARGRMVWELVK